MNALVDSSVRKRLFALLPLPSIAGRGLPERMRSTAVAFLGLTTAAGLALVAIFAQPGFSVLDPAPLPEEPATHLAQAERLTRPSGPERLVAAKAAPAVEPDTAGDSADAPQLGVDTGSAPPAPASGVSAPVESTEPASPEPVESAGSGEGGKAGQPSPSDTAPATPGPADSPASGESSTAAGNASPPPSPPAPPPPKATTSSPTPPQPTAPGSSSSSAAAAHASERGIEASSASVSAAPPSPAPEVQAEPGNGSGNAKGLSK